MDYQTTPDYYRFIVESNAIEGLHHQPTPAEIQELERFLLLDEVKIPDLKKFVSVCAPGHVLRNKPGLNVSIGGRYAPLGGRYITPKLKDLLAKMTYRGPYLTHVNYEILHPFTDGNGRSGRMLWLWQMCRGGYFPKLGFLHTFYYQALQNARKD